MSRLFHHDPSSDVMLLGVHSESTFSFMEYFSSQENCLLRKLSPPCLLLITESTSLDTFGKPAVTFS